ncbi:MAG: MerR family transcriptional regulator [Acidipropionibacterium acidipropionici]|nr:MerR family transcriptional regulator [Acidipropionibacterium acidipropionici]
MLIGEVSRRSGVSVRMLRHYDRIGLVKPSARTGTGYREYGPQDLQRLLAAEALRTLGLSLAQVGQALDDPDFDAAGVIERLIGETEARIAAEHSLLVRLRGIEASEPRSRQDVLDVVGLLSALRSGDPARRVAAALSTGSEPTGEEGPRMSGQLVDSYLDEPDDGVAGTLRWAVARAGRPALEALADRARDIDRQVRLRIVLALDEFDDPASSSLLAGFLGDPDLAVAGHAALVLARGRAGAAEPRVLIARLVTMVVAGMDDVGAAEALATLAHASPDTAAEVVDALSARLDSRGADASQVRSRIAQALGEVGGTDAAEVLAGLARDPDPAVRSVAEYLLG